MTKLHRVGDQVDSASSGRVPRFRLVTSPTNATRSKRHFKRRLRSD